MLLGNIPTHSVSSSCSLPPSSFLALPTPLRSPRSTCALPRSRVVQVGKADSESRIRNNMHSTLTKKFVQSVKEYQEMQTKYKNKYRCRPPPPSLPSLRLPPSLRLLLMRRRRRERVGRQLKVVKPDASPEEIDKLMESGQTNVFSQQLLAERSTQVTAPTQAAGRGGEEGRARSLRLRE